MYSSPPLLSIMEQSWSFSALKTEKKETVDPAGSRFYRSDKINTSKAV